MASVKRFWLLVPFILSLAFISSTPLMAGELTDALKLRDVARVRSLLATGADLNEKVHGDYPLNIAAVWSRKKVTHRTLHFGAKSDLDDEPRSVTHH